MEKFEQKQYLSEKEAKKPEEIKVEIPKEEWQALETIAKRVGGDFGMEVKLGKPGGGSFFNSEDGSITFDPLHIKENPELAKFVAGHEGSHRAITPSPKEIGLSQEQIKENYSQIGFDYLQNVIEDPAVNDWMRKRFPGLDEYVKKTYDEQLKEENAVLSTPEVKRIVAQLGYWPKFSQYGSEEIRDWHQGRFSKKLDPAVEKALKRTIEDARKSWSTIPNPERRERKEIISTAQERFRINTDYIWPEVKKLVEMDLHTEEQRQMMEEFRQKQKELGQKQKEMEQAKARGDESRQEELQKEIEGLEKELDPFNGLPEDTKKELQEQIDKAIREAAEKLNKEIKEKEKRAQEAKEKQEQLEKENQELEEKAKGASGKEKEELEKQIQQKKEEKLLQEMKQKQGEKELKDIQDTLDQIQSGKEMPYPEDKLSERTKQELDKLFKKLPSQKKKEFRKKSEKQLEDFEDAINKEMEGKLNEDKPESHKERREREKAEREVEKERKKTEEERKELERKLEEMRREKMTEYDKAYTEVADIINSLYVRLKRFFLPERHPKWKGGYSSGSRLPSDMTKVMQAEADPRYLEKIWERKTIPSKLNYLFTVLVDLSASMTDYGKDPTKLRETFKAVVVLSEVLNKLGIDFEVIGFSTVFPNDVKIYKSFLGKFKKMTTEERKALSELLKDVKPRAFTPTSTATNYASRRLQEQVTKIGSKNNFLITLTDGKPNRTSIEDPVEQRKTKEEIKKAQELRQKLIGIGIGKPKQIYYVKDFYKASIIEENVKKLGEVFAELLEDMIKHPEKY